MTDTRKLLDDSPDEVTSRLLRSALDDEPSARAFSRTAVALGVSGLVPLATTTAAASASAGATSTSAKLIGLLGFKWFGLGAVLGLIVAGGASSVLQKEREPATIAVPAASGTRVATVATQQALATSSPEATAVAPPVQPKARRDGVPSAANENPERVPSTRTPTIAREIAVIDGARAALRRNDPKAALSAIDALEREGTIALDPEATVIRVEALLARGETSKAAALARRFMAENPSTPHANRMQEIIRNQK